MKFYTYILYSEVFVKYYIGQTNNMEDRLKRHNSEQVQSTKPYVPWVLVLKLEKPSRTESMNLERKLKNLNRQRLLEFIKKYS